MFLHAKRRKDVLLIKKSEKRQNRVTENVTIAKFHVDFEVESR
jgi:hypothetical protein